MLTPLSNRPKITADALSQGFVNRYFVRNPSSKKIVEIDAIQYVKFKNNPYFDSVVVPWVITGNDKDIVDPKTGRLVLGVPKRNLQIINYYDSKMPGLRRLLQNPMEYFNGTYVKANQIAKVNPIVSSATANIADTTTTPPTSSATPIPEYWWRADSGLSTSGWVAYNGGIDFTFTNVSTADSFNGAVFNGVSGYGVTPNLTSDIIAKHVFLRVENFVAGTRDSIMGGTQNNIHEIGFTDLGYWFVVDIDDVGTLRYATRTLTDIAPSNLIWFDFTNDSDVQVYVEDNASPIATMNTYAGAFTNNFIWQSGYGIYLARRKETSGGGSYIRMDVKELAIFTTALTAEEAKEFRTEMLNRNPI